MASLEIIELEQKVNQLLAENRLLKADVKKKTSRVASLEEDLELLETLTEQKVCDNCNGEGEHYKPNSQLDDTGAFENVKCRKCTGTGLILA